MKTKETTIRLSKAHQYQSYGFEETITFEEGDDEETTIKERYAKARKTLIEQIKIDFPQYEG